MVEFKRINSASKFMFEAAVGIIPTFLYEDDPRSAAEQFDSSYIGGWHPFQGFRFSKEKKALFYPSDPALYGVAEARLHDETIIVFQYGWVLVLQPTGEWEVARMD